MMADWTTFDEFLAAAQAALEEERPALVDALLAEQSEWPWISGPNATFALRRPGTSSAALNLDTIQADPPFAPMAHLPGTDFWYVTYPFEPDDLLDYMIAIDDPGTPLSAERDLAGRVALHWGTDPLNPRRMETAQMNVSVLRMPQARPFPDWTSFKAVPRGHVYEHTLGSQEIGFIDRRVWVYTPPGYETSPAPYPLLIMQDGQWAIGPLQVPAVADALIKHGRMQPALIAMVQSGAQDERLREYMASERYSTFLLAELLPFLQTNYAVDASQVGIGGVDLGAVAAAHAALRSPAVFSRLILISAPLGRGAGQDTLRELVARLESSPDLPDRIFQAVGRYEAKGRFLKPARALRDRLSLRRDTDYHYVELGSGHGLVGFRSVLPEALAHAFPGDEG
jgi:enterochelin esterase-like enzyme